MAKGYRTEIAATPHLTVRVPSADELKRQTCAPFSVWFNEVFPEAVRAWGPGFVEGRYEDAEGYTRFVPVEVNEDAWACALGGRADLAQQVVYVSAEASWWFLDYRMEAFCECSEERLKLLLSNYLVRCSQSCGPMADIEPLVTTFRKRATLNRIIDKAKTMLEADEQFFSGANGRKRIISGKIVEATAKPSYELFVEKAVTREAASALSVSDAFHRYFNFCREHQMSPLTRAEFKSLVAEVVREQFGCGIRRDVPGKNGKQAEGWIGLSLRLQEPATLGRS